MHLHLHSFATHQRHAKIAAESLLEGLLLGLGWILVSGDWPLVIIWRQICFRSFLICPLVRSAARSAAGHPSPSHARHLRPPDFHFIQNSSLVSVSVINLMSIMPCSSSKAMAEKTSPLEALPLSLLQTSWQTTTSPVDTSLVLQRVRLSLLCRP